ncbi:MAG: O-antigen/teichoic acid export membrane protein [Saprospiraceae bacterium]|jgi:O-antigen/teichoic acid export membrane protein
MNAFGWQSINVIVQSVIQLIFNALLARLISKESFGIMAIVLIITGFIDIFAQIGIGPAIIQKKEITKSEISGSFYLSAILGIIFFSFLWISAPHIAQYYHDDGLSPLLRVIGLSFIISAISIIPKSLLLKKLMFKQLFISVTIGMIVGLMIVGLTLAYLDFEVWAYALALLSQSLIMTICYWYFHPIKLEPLRSIKKAKSLIRYGGGSTLFTFFNYLSSKIDVFLVSRYAATDSAAGNNWGETGVYDQSLKVMSYPITIIGKLSDSVMFSGLSMIQDQTSKLKFAYRSAFSVLATISLPSSVFLVIFSEEVVLILLGDKYLGAIPVVQVLFIGLFMRTIIKLSDAVIRALDRVYIGAFIKFVYFLFISLFVWIALSEVSFVKSLDLGLTGVAIALVLAVFIQFMLMTALTLSILKVKLSEILKLIIGPLIIASVALGICLLTKIGLSYLGFPVFVNIMAGILSLGLSYVIIIWFIPKSFGSGEHNMLNILLRKLPSKGIMKILQQRVEQKTNK